MIVMQMVVQLTRNRQQINLMLTIRKCLIFICNLEKEHDNS